MCLIRERKVKMAFQFLKKKNNEKKSIDNISPYADSSSIPGKEKVYYRDDEYYTKEKPSLSGERKVITFEERKVISFASESGLYVAEILLLHYCTYGKYPNPKSGYPGFWWFEYGIRDVGNVLRNLESRGFIEWAPKDSVLRQFKVGELKTLLADHGIEAKGKKEELINKILLEIPEEEWGISDEARKYKLTILGEKELNDNGYVPYMHNHPHKTVEGSTFGKSFTVWDINKEMHKGNAKKWQDVVGEIELSMFGVKMAGVEKQECTIEEFNNHIEAIENDIIRMAKIPGDGFNEESKGLDYVRIGDDKSAILYLLVSVEKNFDAPALYIQAAELLEKYELNSRAIAVLEKGLENVDAENWQRVEIDKKLKGLRDKKDR